MNSIWLNRGSLMPQPALNDRGFSFGFKVMTTLLWENGVYVDLGRHLSRLRKHAEDVGLSVKDLLEEEVKFELDACRQQLGVNLESAACRVFLTAGLGRLHDAVTETQRWISVEKLDFSDGINSPLKLFPAVDLGRRRGEHIKSAHYLDSFTQIQSAKAQGFDDVLWCNSDSELTETVAGNIFLIGRHGDLVEIATPPASSGLLLGVTRHRIIELLNGAKIPVTERAIYKEEIPRFDEGFVTSSLTGIRPVSLIGKHRLHSERDNSVVGHVVRLWSAWRKSL